VFDDVWRSAGAKIILTPVRAPNANAVAERWVGSVRRECLDQLLIVGRKQLVRVLRTYVGHYNQRRPHRSLAHATPVPMERAEARSKPDLGRLRRRDVLGGLIHEYEYADDTLASGTPRAAFLRTRDRSPVSLSGAENSLTAGELPARTAEPLGFRPSDHGAPADRRLTGSRVLSVYRAARTVRGSFATTSS
jgi:hypothetical protein